LVLGNRGWGTAKDVPEKEKAILAHDVYFQLKDNSSRAKAQLVDACRKYLSRHDGEVFFAVGTRAEDADAMFDKDFDVALHMYFQNKEARDRVSDSRQHKQFVAECRENWKKVRMFDSAVQR
jgi:hypothetical protein